MKSDHDKYYHLRLIFWRNFDQRIHFIDGNFDPAKETSMLYDSRDGWLFFVNSFDLLKKSRIFAP
jgi:hypothetical protein